MVQNCLCTCHRESTVPHPRTDPNTNPLLTPLTGASQLIVNHTVDAKVWIHCHYLDDHRVRRACLIDTHRIGWHRKHRRIVVVVWHIDSQLGMGRRAGSTYMVDTLNSMLEHKSTNEGWLVEGAIAHAGAESWYRKSEVLHDFDPRWPHHYFEPLATYLKVSGQY